MCSKNICSQYGEIANVIKEDSQKRLAQTESLARTAEPQSSRFK